MDRGISPGRGARIARRDERGYREYLSEEQRSEAGCSAVRMQMELHHGLLRGLASRKLLLELRKALLEMRNAFLEYGQLADDG